jgi:hypothetical protein
VHGVLYLWLWDSRSWIRFDVIAGAILGFEALFGYSGLTLLYELTCSGASKA